MLPRTVIPNPAIAAAHKPVRLGLTAAMRQESPPDRALARRPRKTKTWPENGFSTKQVLSQLSYTLSPIEFHDHDYLCSVGRCSRRLIFPPITRNLHRVTCLQ